MAKTRQARNAPIRPNSAQFSTSSMAAIEIETDMGAGARGVAYPKKVALLVQIVELSNHSRQCLVGLVGQGVAVEKA